jgi:hypothetical protein
MDVMLEWHHSAAGFHVGAFSRNHQFVVIPHWPLAMTAAVLPGMWFRRRLQRTRRLSAGCCSACGYDLTGNTSGVCPECGTAVAGKDKVTT